jgi:hypothetical protein
MLKLKSHENGFLIQLSVKNLGIAVIKFPIRTHLATSLVFFGGHVISFWRNWAVRIYGPKAGASQA